MDLEYGGKDKKTWGGGKSFIQTKKKEAWIQDHFKKQSMWLPGRSTRFSGNRKGGGGYSVLVGLTFVNNNVQKKQEILLRKNLKKWEGKKKMAEMKFWGVQGLEGCPRSKKRETKRETHNTSRRKEGYRGEGGGKKT